ncbi:hypothetical protein F4Y43_10125 [Candidatus Poribacteria bacterium]|nr:hypothetical protein [Candidatus Poribacteria bacterium]
MDTSRHFKENIVTGFESDYTTEMIVGSIVSVRELETPEIPEPSTRNTSVSLELNFGKEIKSGVTQEFADTRQQRLAFPTYDEEDILNWDAVVVPPPPRRSGTIRVKLIYKGRSKPIPDDDPWE